MYYTGEFGVYLYGGCTKTSVAKILDNKWHHIAAVLPDDSTPTAGEIQLYLDGQLQTQTTSGLPNQSVNTVASNDVTIGAFYGPNPAAFFNGSIDEARIYDRALDASEIQNQYQQRLAAGSGIRGNSTQALIEKCVIKENHSDSNGGGITGFDGQIKNSLFIRNSSDSYGGAIAGSQADILNCTLVGNSALSAGAIYSCGGDILNSIFWDNDLNEVVGCNFVQYCCIQDWISGGQGNISYNPCFTDAAQDDYSLLSFSPSIDAGDPNSDYSNEPEDNGDRVNMGYLGNTIDAEIADRITDTDNDGLTNYQEIILGTDYLSSDTDEDGMPDGWEVDNSLNPLDSADAMEDPDNDGLTNCEEYNAQTDIHDSDSDDDGMKDGWEVDNGLNPLSSSDKTTDLDNDGYVNFVEYLHNSAPGDPNSLPEIATITVPVNVPTIQEAIDWSIDGDEILILKGEYKENILVDNKSVIITGTDTSDWNTIAQTKIIADDPNLAVVEFSNCELFITGLMITGGEYGIECTNSASPVIKNCIVEANISHEIYIESGCPVIKNNMIGADTTETDGSGIYCSNSYPVYIYYNIIYKNKSHGINLGDTSLGARIFNNTIVANLGDGIYANPNAAVPQIDNTIFWDNSGTDLVGCTANYSCVQDSSCIGDPDITHNISQNPDFLSSSLNDYRINRDSPCVDAGDPNTAVYCDYDIESEERLVRQIDIGADEVCEVHNVTQNIWYRTIQDSIDNASNGDMIQVYEWEYFESVNFDGLSITLTGIDPNNWKSVESTIINSDNPNVNVVTFNLGEDPNSIIKGFTIKGGNHGIYCDGASPTITQCLIQSNASDGLYCLAGSPVIKRNKISGNAGDGIHSISTTSLSIEVNIIHDNQGCGVNILNSAVSSNIYNNTIVQNLVGICVDPNSTEPDIKNCIIWQNATDLSGCTASYSCLTDPNDIGDPNTSHNISQNPQFFDEEKNDYHIVSSSPCVGMGDPNIAILASVDIDGQPLMVGENIINAGPDTNIVRCVKEGSINGNGVNWTTAYNNIQSAINDSSAQEIWVARGTYKSTSRSNSIELKTGKAVYGGFYGNESEKNQRDYVANVTVLSGDIDAAGNEDSYHVVIGADGAILDGFVIENGYADGVGQTNGAGMYNIGCAPKVENCIFQNNYAAGDGGAIFNCGQGSEAKINRCTFKDNNASGRGGAILNYFYNRNITNSFFLNNAASDGGAICIMGWSTNIDMAVINSVFYGNNATSSGGAIANYLTIVLNYPKIINCTMYDNTASTGNSIYNFGSYSIISNCIAWGTAENQIYNWGSAITNSDIKGYIGAGNNGNKNEDPLFVNTNNILGPDGLIGTIDDGLRIQFQNSPCIDSGDNTIINSALFDSNSDGISDDISICYRIQDGNKDGNAIVDMGAYEMPNVWFVDNDAAVLGSPRDGSSWSQACATLTDALSRANGKTGEIWVANGTYYPGTINQRSNSFNLATKVGVYGGFKGFSEGINAEKSREQRNTDPTTNNTILSGNIDGTIYNSYHVTKGANNSLLDGFTIQGGYADESGDEGCGGGMLNIDVTPTVSHCIFKDNYAKYYGGAIYNLRCNSANFANCIFSSNIAKYDTNNNGVFNTGEFGYGGAMCNNASNGTTVANCTFYGNMTWVYGGAIAEFATVTNQIKIRNSIFWSNTSYGGATGKELAVLLAGRIHVSYCDTQYGTSGVYKDSNSMKIWSTGNFSADPLFANPASGNFYLKSVIGRWDTLSSLWVLDTVTSPCIQSGDSSLSCSLEPIPNGGKSNMGFEGNTNKASKFTVNTITVTLMTDDNQSIDSGWTLYQAGVPYDNIWHPSGSSTELAPGTYTMTFKPVTNYASPSQQDIVVSANEPFVYTYTTLMRYVSTSGNESNNGKTRQTAYRNINTGLTNVPSGGTVTVLQGTYNEYLTLPTGKSYTLLGESTPIINNPVSGHSVLTIKNVSAGVVVSNFTIENGFAVRGGGIYIENCSPTIESCNITGNYASNAIGEADGGGIYIYGGSPLIQFCNINGNTANGALGGVYTYGYGGGIYTYWTSARFVNCYIGSTSANDVSNINTHGDEIYTKTHPSYLDIRPCYNNCTIRGGLYGTNCQYLNASPYQNCQ